MVHRTSSYRVAAFSNALLVALASGYPASAQDPFAFDHEAELECTEEAESELVVFLEGLVVGPDGAPAAGAVVVSSAGGQAVTDGSGSFRIESRVPLEAESVQITAVGRAGTNLLASTQVALPASGSARVGPLLLVQAGTCSPSWLPTFGGEPGVGAHVMAVTVFDDGTGPALHVGGLFTTAGGVVANYVAKWNGSTWAPLGSGMNYRVFALTVFDDGAGPALYAGGEFTTAGGVAANYVAKWDGTSWTPLGSGMTGFHPVVAALAVFDDGGGPALYAGGNFTSAGGMAANYIAKWDGSSWTPLGSGMDKTVADLTVFDDGGGPALYAGGDFKTAGGVATNYIAKWDGSNWAPLGSGPNGYVLALAAYDDGGGPALYAGGYFWSAGGVAASNIAKWDGSNWASLGSGTDDYVLSLTAFDDGSGSALYAGGLFTTAGNVAAYGIAKWDGSNWTALGSGMSAGFGSEVHALAVFDDGDGPALFAGGHFSTAGGVAAKRIAKWDGSSWSALGTGMSSFVYALTVFDDGGGPSLYAGGSFTSAGGVAANRIAKWDGSSWTPLGSGMDKTVAALTLFDDGGGPALYAGGFFTSAGGVAANYIAKWDGSSWTPLGGGMNNGISALTVYDDGGGPALYVGGHFTTAGGVPANYIAKWNGATWTPLGSGMNGLQHEVRALTVYDDGGGPALYAGGDFTTAGGVSANRIAKWDGSSWTPLGSGTSGPIYALTVYDDGGGPALFAGGAFTTAGGVVANNIAKWDGSGWTLLGSGMMNNTLLALTVFDGGGGAELYAGGYFTIAGGVAANYIAKWDGSGWAALGSGMSHVVAALAVFDDGTGLPALFAGGVFASAFDSGDSYLAKWSCPVTASGTVYCTAGTTTNGCVPAIAGSGNASASGGAGFTISVAGVEGQQSGLIFYGVSGSKAAPWGAGTSRLCVQGPLKRMSAQGSGGTAGACDGVLSEDWNAYVAAHSTALGQPFTAGATVWAQGWFSDPPAPKSANLSDALVFQLLP